MLRQLLAALALGVLAAPAAAQSLEVKAGSPLSIESLTIRADVDEGLARVDVDQVFRNGTDAVREGTYTFRLPEHAVVHALSMWMDGKEKHGQVLEAQTARRVYDSIVHRRRDPALLEEIGWRTFRVSVFPIPARDTVRIRLVYAHVVDDDLGLRTLEIPMPEGVPVGVTDVRVNVRDAAGVSVVDCPSHAKADVLHDEQLGAVRLVEEGATPTGPLLVRSAPAVQGFGLSCLAHRPAGAGEGTFLLRVVPRLDDVPEVPRDVVFVVDRSGSMEGTKLRQAQAALRYGISTLREGDRFGVIAFSTDVQELCSGQLVPASEEWCERARTLAGALTASGGTNIDAALARARSLRTGDPARMFVVAFLTDGMPTVGENDPDRIVARHREDGGDATRLFAFGVGGDVKDFLLSRLADAGRGAAEYVREDEDLEVKLSALFHKVHSPVLANVRISVEGDGAHVLGMEPEVVPDVFRGTAVVVAGRYGGFGPARIRMTGDVAGTPVSSTLDVVLPEVADAHPHVTQLWARMRIDRLLDAMRVHGFVQEIRDEIVTLGVRHQVVSPYTSLLVVEDGVHIPDDGELARVPEGPHSAEPSDPPPPTSGGGVTTHASGGHGGRYRGPAGDVPPDSREPSDPPPAESDGPATPGGETGGPTTGGGDVGGPVGPSTGGAGRPSTRARRPGFEGWRNWLETHHDALFRTDARRRMPLPDDMRDTEVLPVLRRVALDDDADPYVRAACIQALARWGDDDADVDALRTRMILGRPAPGERSYHRACRDAAVRALLHAPLTDTTRARLLSALADTQPHVRATAALVLGLSGSDVDGAVRRRLLELLTDQSGNAREVRPSAIFALGLLGDGAAIPALAAAALDDGRPEIERAYAADALGRLRAFGQARDLRGLLLDARAPRTLRRAIPAALARMIARGDVEGRTRIVDDLVRAVRDSDDETVRDMAALALGRIAGDADVAGSARQDALRSLELLWRRGRPATVRPYVALGLGLATARGADTARDSLTDGKALRSPDLESAVVVARALAGDGLAAWLPVARDRGVDRDLRRTIIRAAGDAGAPSGADILRTLDPTDAPDVLREALLSRAALGDLRAADELLALAKGGEPDPRVFDVLGRVGGAAVARALSEVVLDAPDGRARVLAARALGTMSATPDPRRRVADLFPYRAYTEPVWRLMDWR